MSNRENQVTWFELPTDDTKRAAEFYQKVFGWNVEKNNMIATTPETDPEGNPLAAGSINGIFQERSSALQSPKIVIRVADIDAKLLEIKKAGGRILQGKTAIEGMNMAYAIFSDTENNLVNITGRLL